MSEEMKAILFWLAEEMRRGGHCGQCGAHDPHDVCDQPDWERIGIEMKGMLLAMSKHEQNA